MHNNSLINLKNVLPRRRRHCQSIHETFQWMRPCAIAGSIGHGCGHGQADWHSSSSICFDDGSGWSHTPTKLAHCMTQTQFARALSLQQTGGLGCSCPTAATTSAQAYFSLSPTRCRCMSWSDSDIVRIHSSVGQSCTHKTLVNLICAER